MRIQCRCPLPPHRRPPPAAGCRVAPSSCSTSHRVALPAPMGRGTHTADAVSGAVELGGMGMCLGRMAGAGMHPAARDPGCEGAAEGVTGARRSPHGAAALTQPLCCPNTLVPACLPTLICALQNSASLLFILHLQSCIQARCTFSLLFLAHPACGQFWPAASCCRRQKVSSAPPLRVQAYSFFRTPALSCREQAALQSRQQVHPRRSSPSR